MDGEDFLSIHACAHRDIGTVVSQPPQVDLS